MSLGSKAIMYNVTFRNIMTRSRCRGYKNVLDLLVEVCKTEAGGGVIADRTGTFQGMIKTETEAMPSIPNNFTKTFEDICNERAAELIATNKELIVTWSGGIDSTGVLVSLIKAAGTNTDQIKVKFERRSIDENPDFYNNHIKDKLNHEIFTEYFPTRCLPTSNQLVIGGDNTAQIFGLSKTSFMDNRFDPWQPYVRSKLSDFEYDVFMKSAALQFAKSPFPIVSIFDLHWWVSFSMRWTNPQVRMWRVSNEYNEEMFRNTVSFYGSQDFQIWSLLNHDKKIGNSPTTFKSVIKDIIYDYDGNNNYYDNAVSVSSGAATKSEDAAFNNAETFSARIMNNELPILVDNNFNRYYRSDVISNLTTFDPILGIFDESGAFNPNSEWYKNQNNMIR